ncbi:U20-hexatoxin-Hi1a-like [Haemaphysalis longicornis]
MTGIILCFVLICAFVADSLSASTGQTDCQRRRLQEQHATGNLTGLLVPECDEHGEYLPIQCFGATTRGRRFCACYDREFGQIKAPSLNLVSCACIRQHHDWEHAEASARGNEPHCNLTSGEFKPVQCSPTHHWCVNTTSGEPVGEHMAGGCSGNLSSVTCGIDGTHHGHASHHDDSAHGGSSSHHGHTSGHGDSTHHSGASHDAGSGHHDHHS